MAIYLGLGCNEGDRVHQMEWALDELVKSGFRIDEISPLVESPAMLPDDAPPAWNKPYLNCVVKGDANWQPLEALAIAKEIEKRLGRVPTRRWAPRPMDIDILLWHEQIVSARELTIPHIGLSNRAFVLSPLCYLAPNLVVPGLDQTVFALTQLSRVIPLWMGIVNVTPDSFSDGGVWSDADELEKHLDTLVEEHIQIMDIGAESTRPGAETISEEAEWQRLKPVLESIAKKRGARRIFPKVSVDSRNAHTMAKALEWGVDIINDVGGLSNPDMLSVARQSDAQIVAMHSVAVPADPSQLLPTDQATLAQMKEWLLRRIDSWLDAGIDLNRVIFDPGVGFGKNGFQTLDLLSDVHGLRDLGLRILMGHSRKSFMGSFAGKKARERDYATLGMSMALCEQGADIIRVHDPVMHHHAYRGWVHVIDHRTNHQ